MDEENNVPMLFSFYFGDSAVSAQRGASGRLRKWSRAFEMWMTERKRDTQKDTVKQAAMAWRRLVRQCGKMPWEIRREDIEQHAAWMNQEGFAASTTNCAMGIIASFYHWCDKQQMDTACEPGFNPAKEAARMKMRRYEGASLWSREEVGAFLELLSRDGSELGRREYAFFLARLYLGVPLKNLQQLRWEQIEEDEAGAWMRWREDGERVRLPLQVWQAMREYLRVSGRLEGMREGKYIFAPLAEPGVQGSGGRAEDWLEEKPLSSSAILSSLKLYGRQMDITEVKLTLMALRRTAIRLRMDQGESLEGMKSFMDSREEFKSTKYRLGWLPEMPEESKIDEDKRGSEVEVPVRRAKPFKEGENTTHGFYTRKKDIQAVREVMAEDIHGMEQETACLRKLMRGLLEREGDEARLVEAYSQAAQRLGSLITVSEPLEKAKEDPWAEQLLTFLDEIELREGRPPVSQQIREKALGLSSETMEATGMVTEEIATIRLLLRNVYSRAMQGIETREYLRLVDLYGLGCVRLGRLIKIGGCDGNGRLERYLQNMIDEAIRYLTREWGLDRED
jgi:integrase